MVYFSKNYTFICGFKIIDSLHVYVVIAPHIKFIILKWITNTNGLQITYTNTKSKVGIIELFKVFNI